MEIGKPSDRMLTCGAALEIRPVAREVRKSVPRMGRLITIASRKRRDRPESMMLTILSLPSIIDMTLIDWSERQNPPRKSYLKPSMETKISIETRFRYWPIRGFSIWDSGSKVSDAPKPICREKNWPAVEKAAKIMVR